MTLKTKKNIRLFKWGHANIYTPWTDNSVTGKGPSNFNLQILRGLSRWNAPTEPVKTPLGLSKGSVRSLTNHIVNTFFFKACTTLQVTFQIRSPWVIEENKKISRKFRFFQILKWDYKNDLTPLWIWFGDQALFFRASSAKAVVSVDLEFYTYKRVNYKTA